jgi:N12 class adenine-specific DNA methylase
VVHEDGEPKRTNFTILHRGAVKHCKFARKRWIIKRKRRAQATEKVYDHRFRNGGEWLELLGAAELASAKSSRPTTNVLPKFGLRGGGGPLQ